MSVAIEANIPTLSESICFHRPVSFMFERACDLKRACEGAQGNDLVGLDRFFQLYINGRCRQWLNP